MLKKILIKQHKSIAEFAREVGFSRQYLHRVINGEKASPLAKQKIADALNLPVETIFPIEEEVDNGSN